MDKYQEKIIKHLWEESTWKYHLWSILKWLNLRLSKKTYYQEWETLFIPFGKTYVFFDIDKPPMERSEDKNKELLEFMDILSIN